MTTHDNDEIDEILDLDDSLELPGNAKQFHEHYRVVADTGQSLMRVDKFLSNHLEKVSRSRIQDAADSGYLFANDAPIKSNYKIKPHDVITIKFEYERHQLEIIPENIPLTIAYEDDDVIVINKPPGLVVHPGHGNYTGTLVNALAHYYKDYPYFNGGNDPRTGLVHRIDKDTSGLLVVAKNEVAKTMLAKQFFDKTSIRQYQAIVWGIPEPNAGTITGFIGRNLQNRQHMHVFADETLGKWAVTHYKVIEPLQYVSLVECRLETGRTHQIRAHFKHIKHPLFNDSTYGGNEILRGTTFTKYKQFIQNCFSVCPRQALHARTLGFVHPSTGKDMFFEAEMPSDMKLLLEKWRHYLVYNAQESE